MADRQDVKSFVLRSTYRMGVIRALSRSGQLTPTAIAKKTDIRQPHVSRALSELRKKDLVTLAVAEDQHKGRLYELTQFGADIWADITSVDWQGPADSIPDDHQRVITRIQQVVGDQLLIAGYFDGCQIDNYYLSEPSQGGFSEERVEKTVETLVDEFSWTDTYVDKMAGTLHYEIQSFTRFHRIVIYIDDGFLTVGLDRDCQFEFLSLIEDCLDILGRHPSA